MGSAHTLVDQLKEIAGRQELTLVIPYPFLPPRFLKDAEGRNLLLRVGKDGGIVTLWEGARFSEHAPIAPKAAIKLLLEVADRGKRYSEELQEWGSFLT